MKIKRGGITIIFRNDGMEIELHDRDASITFAEVTLTPKQTMQAFSGLGFTGCEMSLFGLGKIGKKMENGVLEFPLPEGEKGYKMSDEELTLMAEAVLPDGWESDNHFHSQNTFFSRDGKNWARTIMRRWV